MNHERECGPGEKHGACNHIETWMSFFSCLCIWELKIKTPTFQSLYERHYGHAIGSTELIKDRHLVPFGMPGSMRAPAGSPEGQRPPTGDAVAALCGGLRYPEHLGPLRTPDCKDSSYISAWIPNTPACLCALKPEALSCCLQCIWWEEHWNIHSRPNEEWKPHCFKLCVFGKNISQLWELVSWLPSLPLGIAFEEGMEKVGEILRSSIFWEIGFCNQDTIS